MSEQIPHKIGLIPNPTKPKALDMLPDVIKILDRLGFSHLLSKEIQGSFLDEKTNFADIDEMADQVDLIIVFGGDGTYLNAARSIAGKDVLLLGVNLGRLGFLTEVDTPDIEWALEELAQGNYTVGERITVEARVFRGGQEIHVGTGLNDIIISKTGLARMVELETYIDGSYLNFYPGDGLIVATPTGSTAYSLSAGGPIVTPFAKSLILTPICPHSLYSRSLVISDEETIKVTVTSEHECALTIDGQFGWELQQHDKIFITAGPEVVKAVRLTEHSFYKILRNRMSGDRM